MSALTPEELERYARHIVLKEIGGTGQMRLKRATVAVIGAGGIGSPAIQYLAAAGIGHLILIDDDTVDASNLQRQTIFATADIAQPKAEAAARVVATLNEHVKVTVQPIRITSENAAGLLANAEAILDGSDNFPTRLAVADTALSLKIPLISSAVGQFEGQLATFRGWEAEKPCYRCFVGSAPDREVGSCAEDGILGPVTGILGSLAALEVIRALVPFGEDSAGKLVLIDLLALRFRNVRLTKDPACPACGPQRSLPPTPVRPE